MKIKRDKLYVITGIVFFVILITSAASPNLAYAVTPIIYMQDTTTSKGLNTYSGIAIHAEYVTGSSVLVGKQIDTIVVQLKKSGSPTGNMQIGVFNTDLSVKKTFGTKDVSTLTRSSKDYTISLPSSDQPYQIQSGDRIGIKFTGGDSTNFVAIMTDQNAANPFDGTNSYHTYYTTAWHNDSTYDLYMTLKVTDTTPPVITLRGSNPVTIERGSTYVDAGATATDNIDGNLTSSIVKSNPVNTALVGTYTVTYNVKDSSGNAATQVTRTVNVVDTTPPAAPVITTLSSTTNNNSPTISGTAEAGSSVQLFDGTTPLDSPVTATGGSWSITTPVLSDGAHSITAKATDASGNISTASSAISITVDTVAPTVSASPPSGLYNSAQSVTLTASEPATIYYTTDGSTPTTSSAIYSSPISIATSTTLNFFAVDTAGNSGTIVSQTYTIDTTPPVITLRGFNPVAVQLGSTYVDAGATALDNVDGNLTSSIVTSNPVNTSVLGTYTVTYNVKDSSGNAATQVTRTVNVVDANAPTVSASPPSGLYNSAQSVTLTASEPATIYYTTDGSTPTTSSAIYSSPISIATSTTLNFFAVDTDGNSGTIVSQIYTIDTIPPTVSASPPGGIYNSAQSVTLTASKPATIYYTTDGSTPTTSSAIYSSSISIGTSKTLKFFAVDTAGNSGTIVSQTYTIDTTPPVITLRGFNPVAVQLGSTYVDAGATALDNVDGNLTSSIVTSNPVNTSVLGTYTVTYNVKDSAGNAATQVTRTVNVAVLTPIIYMQDTTASFGLSTYSGRQIQAEYVSSTSFLVGKQIDTITVQLKKSGAPTGTSTIGIFNTDLSVKKAFGTIDVSTLTTSYKNYIFSLSSSDQPYQIQTGDSIGIKYTGGDSSSNYVAIMTDQSNTFDGINSYLTYYTTKWQSFTSQDLTMTLKLTDIIPPVITLRGSSPVTAPLGSTYVDAGATALDNVDGNLTSSIVKLNPVNTAVVGTYTVTYNVKDSSGNAATQVTRTVNVLDTPPVITLRGSNPVAVHLGLTYVDAGATAFDYPDGNLTSSIVTSNPVNTSVLGTYTVTYNVKDSAGNAATQVTRTVIVTNDTTPPVITLRGSSPVRVALGSTYVDAGATATDDTDGNLTSSIVKSNPVNTSVVGAYTVTYNVSDIAGNAATQVTRTVNVIDTTPITYMQDTTATYGLSTYSARQINAEYVTGSSVLVGKQIDTIIVQLQTLGSPAGPIQVGVFNSDLSVKKLFGTMDADAIAGSYSDYTFSLPSFQTYQIQAGDRIGIKFTGGDASNYVLVMTDQTNSFDGTNTYQTDYTTAWESSTTADLHMILKQTNFLTDTPIITPPADLLLATTNTSRTGIDLGTPVVVDNADPTPVVTNNAPVIFPLGTTLVTWHATDSFGNIGVATQKVIVVSAPNTNPYNKVAMIQFDDNSKGIYTLGKPILDKYGIKTTQYIICGRVGQDSSSMTWQDIYAFQAGGHDIEAHTMTHLSSNHMSQAQLNYEFGHSKDCINANMALSTNWTNATNMALPFGDGWNNKTVINTIIKYNYTMDRANTAPTMYLHCNLPGSGQTNCWTYDINGALTSFNRYDIRGFSHNVLDFSTNNNTQIFQQFIQEVNSATSNTSANSTEIPIIYYHRMVVDNSAIADPSLRGTNVAVLDAEMRYLMENNFRIHTTRDLAYDSVNNFLYFKN